MNMGPIYKQCNISDVNKDLSQRDKNEHHSMNGLKLQDDASQRLHFIGRISQYDHNYKVSVVEC